MSALTKRPGPAGDTAAHFDRVFIAQNGEAGARTLLALATSEKLQDDVRVDPASALRFLNARREIAYSAAEGSEISLLEALRRIERRERARR